MAELVIEEVGGLRRRMLLSGPALPHAGSIEFRDRTVLVTESYGVEREQLVVGDEPAPTTLAGTWTLQQLGAGGPWAWFEGVPVQDPESMALAFAALRQSAEVLRLTWGPFIRYGRISETTWTPGREGWLDWRVDFEWTARDDVQAHGWLAQLPTPEEGLTGFAAAMETALEGIDWAEGMMAQGFSAVQDFLDEYIRGPLAVLTAGGALLGRATQGIERTLVDVVECAQGYIDGLTSYKDAVLRLGELGGVMAAECMAFQNALGNLTGETFAPADDPALQLEAQQHVGGAANVSSGLMGQSGKHIAAAQAQTQTQVPTMRVHVAREGEDLRDVAWTYYGDRERWTDLASHNGLRSTSLWAGQEVVIP